MLPPELLTRDAFRAAVFARDQHLCVLCGDPAVDAHHILERRLWSDGGYYVINGASVCAYHHLHCEATYISVEDVRAAAGITQVLVPDHLYPDQPYDKWGNPVLPNGQRLRGELFFDGSVQKILAGSLHLFTHWVKYPRTFHLPWSEDVRDDDRVMESLDGFLGKRIIVTEKMDGENTTLYADYIHARSVDGRSHESRDWVKGFWGGVRADIPDGWRICGENLFATHSIHYTALPTYFMGFAAWTDRNDCLSWDDTLVWFALIGVRPVPVVYDGFYDEQLIRNLYRAGTEGYVVRTADGFSYGRFRECVGKFVRKGHVKTVKHWMHGQPVVPNELKRSS